MGKREEKFSAYAQQEEERLYAAWRASGLDMVMSLDRFSVFTLMIENFNMIEKV